MSKPVGIRIQQIRGMPQRQVKLCFLGDISVGKSSIVHRFAFDTFTSSPPSTIGMALVEKSVPIGSEMLTFNIWDTAGQEKYRTLASIYYRGSEAAVVVYDITDEDSFDKVKSWVQELREKCDQGIVLAIVGNKCDLEERREVSYLDGQSYANLMGAKFFEVSAKTSYNIVQVFTELGREVMKKPRRESNRNTILVTNAKPSKKCC